MIKKSTKLLWLIPENYRSLSFYGRYWIYEMDQKETASPAPDDNPEKKEDKEKDDADAEAEKKTGGVPIDSMAEEKEEGEAEGVNPNIPPRSPDAMTGKEFQAAYEKVQNDPKERQKLILEQLAKGNVPGNYRYFEPVTIKQGDQTITIFAAKRGITIGDGEDTFEIPLDGPTSRAVADMYDCTIPTPWLSDEIYKHAKERGHDVPFYHQEDFAHHDGTRMQRIDWMRAQQDFEKYKNDFAKMPPDALVAGYHKDVVHPVPGVSAKYPDGVEIYGGYVNGQRIQPLSGRHHNESYVDYSHRTRLISRTAYVNGKKVDIGDLLKDPKIAKAFNFTPLDIDKSYDYSTWSKQYDARFARGLVDAYKKAYPPGGGPPGEKPPGETQSGETAVAAQDKEPSAQPASAESGSSGATPLAPAPAPSAEPASAPGPAPSAEPASTPAPSGTSGTGGSVQTSPSEVAEPAGGGPSSVPAGGTGPGISPSATVENPPVSGVFKTAKNPREFATLNSVPPINEPTAFLGDSINTAITGSQYLRNGGHKYFAEMGRTTNVLLGEVKKNKEEIAKFRNAVVLIGSNDIGGSKDAQTIFNTIVEIWDEILAANPSVSLYVCTIPPFGDYPGYASKKDIINRKREEINAKIREKAATDSRLKLIDLCLPVDKGGLATADGSALNPSVSYEPLHPEKNALAMVYGRAINSSKQK